MCNYLCRDESGLQVAIGDYLSGLTLADVASSAAAANL